MTTFHINGRAVTVDVEEDTPLLWVIRDIVGLTGTKFGCGVGMCGVCTVHVGGRPTRSCITPASNSFRSPSIQTLRMAFDADHKVTAMDHQASAGWPTLVMAPDFMEQGLNGLKYDEFAINGANHWYDVGAQRVRALSNDVANSAFRPGWLRSVGPGWTNWAVETWVARVRVDRGSGWVVVEKLTIVVDAGTVVDPDGALAQVEGGTLWGLSMALHEGTEFVRGQVKDTNLDTYTPLRMGDAPELDIEFIDSTEVPVGLGEPGTTVVAPAIGNAIFAAVGARLRGLPIRPAAMLHALSAKT